MDAAFDIWVWPLLGLIWPSLGYPRHALWKAHVLWALLAKYLTQKSPLVQAIVLGLCTGLFVTATAEANERDPLVGSTVVLVLFSGAAAGAMFYTGFVYQRKHGSASDQSGPALLYTLYAAVWVFGLAAAMLALLGEGGVKVAVLAVVPLVLLAPTAMRGIGMAFHRKPG